MRRRMLWVLCLLVIGYGIIAYLALPDLWRHYEHQPALQNEPRVTLTGAGIPCDPLNVALIGTESELEEAFKLAGFTRAAALGLRSDLRIGESVILDRPDPNAPVSDLFLFGRREDLAFEQEVGRSADQRHHVRFWRSKLDANDGRPLWLGSATFDRGVGVSHRTGQITHHIAPDIDAERDHVIESLIEAGQLVGWFAVSGIGPTINGRNGGGDRYFTDGEMTVGAVSSGNAVQKQPPQELPSPPATVVKDWFFQGLRPLLDSASD